jgi:3-oxoacyl-[acyl-carrier-protein] synthase II
MSGEDPTEAVFFFGFNARRTTMRQAERIVVTGMGVLAPNGVGTDLFWENTLNGVSGISEIERIDAAGLDNKFGGEIKDFHFSDFCAEPAGQDLGRGTQFAIAASTMALGDAGFDPSEQSGPRVGLYLGTTMGESQIAEDFIDESLATGRPRKTHLTYYRSNMIPAMTSARLGLTGPSGLIPTACAAGNYAIGYAVDIIRQGRADIMLAGGVDPWSAIAYQGFNSMFAISPDVCRPFDQNRKGILISEGAAVLVLEREKDARRRGARIYAEIAGYGIGADGHHMTSPHPQGRGGILSGQVAMRQAEVNPEDIDYVCAHGTGTLANDRTDPPAGSAPRPHGRTRAGTAT